MSFLDDENLEEVAERIKLEKERAKKRIEEKKKKIRNFTILGVLVFVLLILGISSCTVIDTGERGVVLRMGKFATIMDEGLNFKLPIVDRVVKMNIRDITFTSKSEVSSKDIQTIMIESSLIYSLDPEKVGNIYKVYGTNIENTIIKPTLAEVVNSNVAKYPIESFVENRAEIANKIEKDFIQRTGDIGISVKSFLITNHDFSEEFDKAIEAKKVAEQQAITANFNKERARLDSEANKYRQAGLSQFVLMEKFLDKWDGHMPKVMGNGNAMSFILDNADLK